MAKTVIGLMGSFDAARRVIDELLESGFPHGDIGLMSNEGEEEADAQPTAANDSGEDADAVASLIQFGVPDDEARYYAQSVRRGGTLIAAGAASDEQAELAVAIMRRHSAIDVDRRVLTPGEAAQVPLRGARVYSPDGEPEVEAIVALEEEEVLVVAPPPVEAPLAAEAKAKRPRKSARKAAGTYAGPERRISKEPYDGVERRNAA